MEKQQAIEELAFIKQVIRDGRRTFRDNGFGYIFWGVLVVTGLLGDAYQVYMGADIGSLYRWASIIGLGWVVTFILEYRRRGRRKVRTFAGKILGTTWFAAGTAMTIIGFGATTAGALRGMYVSPMLSVILGAAFFISSAVTDNKLLARLAFGWWAGALLMFYYPGRHSILIMAGMMLFFQVIPGIILYRNYQKELGSGRE